MSESSTLLVPTSRLHRQKSVGLRGWCSRELLFSWLIPANHYRVSESRCGPKQVMAILRDAIYFELVIGSSAQTWRTSTSICLENFRLPASTSDPRKILVLLQHILVCNTFVLDDPYTTSMLFSNSRLLLFVWTSSLSSPVSL